MYEVLSYNFIKILTWKAKAIGSIFQYMSEVEGLRGQQLFFLF